MVASQERLVLAGQADGQGVPTEGAPAARAEGVDAESRMTLVWSRQPGNGAWPQFFASKFGMSTSLFFHRF